MYIGPVKKKFLNRFFSKSLSEQLLDDEFCDLRSIFFFLIYQGV